MNDTTNPARRLRHGDRPTAPLRWNDRWTLLLTGPHHGMIGPYGSTWPNQPAEYERVNVIAEDAEKLVAQEVTQQAAKAETGSVPDGWKLVPIHPTHSMLDAAGRELSMNDESAGAAESDLEYQADAHTAWDAMLAAAPTTSTVSASGIQSSADDPMRAHFTCEAKTNNDCGVISTLYFTKMGAHGTYQLYRNEAESLYLNIGNALGLSASAQASQAAASDGGDYTEAIAHEAWEAVCKNRRGVPENEMAAIRDALLAPLRTIPATPASAQSATPDAVEAALADAIVHGTGAFRVNGDGSTEHVELQGTALTADGNHQFDWKREGPTVTIGDIQPAELTEQARRHYAELAAFPPKLQRDALYQDYAVPAKPADDGGKPE